MVPFSRPTQVDGELELILEAAGRGDGDAFARESEALLREQVGTAHAHLTTSCTHALEIAAMALDIAPGDEVIVPAFTFPTTASAFLREGATLRFADISASTLNLDPQSVARLVTPRTRAVVAMHYAGIACDMDAILAMAKDAGAVVVEDAAHALYGTYRDRALGTLGALGAFSFHHSKNVSCGEGGAVVTDDADLAASVEIVREKGTNRTAFMRGDVEKYEWVRQGSSYVMAELLAAKLAAQLRRAPEIQARRQRLFLAYQDALADWAQTQGVALPTIPPGCEPAWHLYYLVLPAAADQRRFLDHLDARGVGAAFHYHALNLSPMGRRLGGRPGQAPHAEAAAGRLVRIPLFTSLTDAEQDEVIEAVRAFRTGPQRARGRGLRTGARAAAARRRDGYEETA